MENASKALIMAAGVLVGVLILSLAIYLIVNFGSASAQLHQEVATDQLNQFNSQYTTYQGSNATIYDVVTVANMATENNVNNGFERQVPGTELGRNNYICVMFKNRDIAGYVGKNADIGSDEIAEDTNQIENAINTNSAISRTVDALPKYNCTVNISQITGRVYEVVFTKT